MKIIDLTNFESELNKAWYERGSISESEKILRTAQKHDYEFSAAGQRTVDRVEGSVRLRNGAISVPPRLADVAYLPELGRIMYAVHSTPIFNSNGYSTRTRGVAEGIESAGGEVVVVARSGYPWDSTVDGKMPVNERVESSLGNIPFIHNPGGNLNQQSLDHYIEECSDVFTREARRNRPEIILAASNHRTALPALISARRVGIPFIYEVRGLWEITEAVKKPAFKDSEHFKLQRDLETLVASEADYVLCITQQVADELTRRGINGNKLIIAPNAVDIERYVSIPKDEGFAKRLKFDPKLPTIGFAGSLVEYEGLDTLLKASQVLTNKGVDHQVVIAGSGSEEEALKHEAKERGLENVHFLGRLPQNQIPRLLSTFDIVVCPRKRYEITELVSPLKPLEAYAAGRPTVLSDVAPNRDLAGNNQDRALLFSAENEYELAEKLVELINDDELKRVLARTSHLWVAKERQWKNIGEIVLKTKTKAVEHFKGSVEPAKKLNELVVGLIADEFTTEALCGSVQIEILDKRSWRQQIENRKLDLVFVESAWEGNGGDWHRGVGYYSESEIDDLSQLLDLLEERGIPSIFWNKEDPVHFKRFSPTAIKFDHIFTTDANMIPKYRALKGGRVKTVASLPFFAQPLIHNPIARRNEFRNSISHAGTYYGDRYKERSSDLLRLLSIAEEFGLDIYDRQASVENSPYHFPEHFQKYVRGALPYRDVVDSYRNHIAHLNVNSVTNSPTMFSRRIVEIPASGGVVLSAEGRGIRESIGETIASSNDPETIGALIFAWTSDENQRRHEIWRQMRTIFRAHTAKSALLIAFRTAGVCVSEPQRSTYAVIVPRLTASILSDLKRQSYPPAAVVAQSVDVDSDPEIAIVNDIANLDDSIEYSAKYISDLPRTYYEDFLISSMFGDWGKVGTGVVPQNYIASNESGVVDEEVLIKRFGSNMSEIAFRLPDVRNETPTDAESEPTSASLNVQGKTVLIAGHDLKFAGMLIDELKLKGVRLLFDKWENHTKHDEDLSRSLLAQADIVFCEWGLGNVRWYSRNVKEHQRLVVRVHLQEISRPYLSQTVHGAVDRYIFVGKLIRDTAVLTHGVPSKKTVTIPNSVDVDALDLPKTSDARFTLGFVGIVPQRKRIDLALDLLESLRKLDSRYRLRIKGKMWTDYPWLRNRPEEVAYYQQIELRIAELNNQSPGTVILDEFGDDMAEWYRNIGIVLSTSDYESFHLTIADGAASRAFPAILHWPGADFIYPLEWLSSSIDEMVNSILSWDGNGDEFREIISSKFQQKDVTDRLMNAIFGDISPLR
ncbi:glycosyltransferase [Corynebacterium lubricantis]|uniref:glycosyltransferase n=1 Tax=Corynebacterium lubricantis TaxID=541095 RepID=UPI00039A46EE|nr:glycosyltransferase [Corynebacterium lubricantis]